MFYLETIRLEQGLPQLLHRHRQRMALTAAEGQFDCPSLPDLTALCPARLRAGTVKCRVVYGSAGIDAITFEPYAIRPIETLRMVEVPAAFDYSLKRADRRQLDNLRHPDADEVLIVRDGLLTDTTYTNVVVVVGDRWLTPRRPLLCGVMRQALLETGRAEAADLRPDCLRTADAILLINAMMPPERAPRIRPAGILFP